MATSRLISKSLSTSKRWNRLPTWFAKSLYMLLIVHSDDYGIIDGDAEEIRWKILPASQESSQDIESALESLRELQLIHRYQWQGHSLIEIIQFDSHQQGLHKRTSRKFPEYQEIQGRTENHECAESGFPEIPGNSEILQDIPASRARADVYVYKDKDIDRDKERNRVDTPSHRKNNQEADPSPPQELDLLRQSREEIISHLNETLGLKGKKGYRPNSDKVKLHLNARLKEGFSPEECKIVNAAKSKEWKDDPHMSTYLRPETLYGSKFEGYLRVALLAKAKNGEDDELSEKIKAYKARKAAMAAVESSENNGGDGGENGSSGS